MIRYPSIRRTSATCANRPQAHPVVDWEQLTLSSASVIVGTGPMECEIHSGEWRWTPDRVNCALALHAYSAGGRYKPHRRGARVPAVQFNRSYP
jgi:hypothetical protein